MRHLATVALLLLTVASCNRDSRSSGRDGGGSPGVTNRLPPTEYTPSALPPAQECGAEGQACCSNGDGLSCNDGLICVDGSTCQLPPGETPDLGSSPDLSEQTPDLGGGDLGPGSDLGDVDDPECVCEHNVHGLGLGHCKDNHRENTSGHGNGHCKFDCEG